MQQRPLKSRQIFQTNRAAQTSGVSFFWHHDVFGGREALNAFIATLEILACSQQAQLSFVVADFCSVKADRPGVHKVSTMSLCCACGVINLSGTCNSG